MPQCYYCIVKPDFSVSTPDLFTKMDEADSILHPDTQGMLSALVNSDLMHIAGYVSNAMEPIVAKDHPEILMIKDTLDGCGACGCAMTGSGSAVYGIFDAFDMAAMASMQLMGRYKTYLSTNVE